MQRRSLLLVLLLLTIGLTAVAGQPRELPGCQTCVSFGDEVLSHPLLVEAIEDEFVPVAIYNNRPGSDREILERCGEPAWNNPVVRFLASDGSDLEAKKWFGAVERFEGRVRKASDRNQRYYLRHSTLASFSLTERQSIRVNAALANGRSGVARWLSPRQRIRAGL